MTTRNGMEEIDRDEAPGGEAALPRHFFRSVLLGWTDPESGERLTLDLEASDGFLRRLVREGFELLEGHDGPRPRAGRPARGRALSGRGGGRLGPPSGEPRGREEGGAGP